MGSGTNSIAVKPSEESFRLLLQNTLERNDRLVKINTEATLAIPTILGGLWGVLLNWNKIENLTLSIFSLITIGILIMWRYYAHIIDDDVAGNYSRILRLEKGLAISRKYSIYNGLITKIVKPLPNNVQEKFEKESFELCKDQRIALIENLYKFKKMGYRGHQVWDFVCFISVCSSLTVFFSD